MKRRLAILCTVLALLILAPFAWLIGSESGLHWALKQVQPWAPGELHIARLSGRLIGPITLSGLDYRLPKQRITADRLEFDWHPAELLVGHIDISRLHLAGLQITLPPPSANAAEPQAPPLPEITLPWRLSLHGVRIDDIRLTRQAPHQAQTFHIAQLTLQAASRRKRIDIAHLNLSGENFSLKLDGRLRPSGRYPHTLNVAWTFKPPQTDWLRGRGRLAGDLAKITVKQRLSGPFEARLEGTLKNPREHLTWQAKADITQIDGRRLDPALPALTGQLHLEGRGDLASADVNGRAQAHHPAWGAFDSRFSLRRMADNRLEIDRLTLHAPATQSRLSAHGEWRPGADGGSVDLALDWEKLRWPLTGTPWFDSAIGTAWLHGSLAQYQIGIATTRPWAEAPPSDWYASADGDRHGMAIHALRVALLDGETLARGRLDWADHFHWQARAKARSINPAGLRANWPGRLNATLSSTGRIDDGQLAAQAEIQHLEGELRGYPVSLHARLGWRAAGLDIADLVFQSGQSSLTAAGRVADSLSLRWSLASPDLAELYPQAGGRLTAEGRISGARATPDITSRFKGQGLSLADYRIGSIAGELAVDLFRWQRLALSVQAQTLQLKGMTLQTLRLEGDGSDGRQRLRAAISAAQIDGVLALSGQASPSGWQGRLEQADVSSRHFDTWRLQTPARLAMDAQSLHMQPLCWQSADAKLCLQLQHRQTGWQANLDAEQVPLKLLTPWLPAGLSLDGGANAHADFSLQRPARLRGKAHIELPAGVVNYPVLEGEYEHWRYQDGRIDLTLDDHGLRAASALSMDNGDRFHGKLALPGAELLTLDSRSQPLRASATLHSHQLGVIEALLPEVQNLQGEAAIDLHAAGTLAQPRLSGNAYLRNGALRLPRLGLRIERLALHGRSESAERFDFQLTAHSGDGSLEIQGNTRLAPAAGWPTQLSIKGHDFEVAHIPEARVLASPDLHVAIQGHTIQVDGAVHIPYAKLQPKDITTAAKVSADTQIVGEQATPAEKWRIFSKVRLTLGERVSLFGFGFEGRFDGNLLLQDEPGQLTRATGELSVVEGRYRAYGQQLEVEHGRLLFAGGPLSNPGLDLRAVRHVGEVTAGLKVHGTLRHPELELFSIPAMGQTDALAYLLLGHPIEGSSQTEGAMMARAALALGLSGGDRLARSLGERFGLDEMRIETGENDTQTSLVMGRYLSPRLYVSYGIGLIESFNTLILRYQISNKLQLMGESGKQIGADLIYTLEY